jgi:serine/threonine protein kinase
MTALESREFPDSGVSAPLGVGTVVDGNYKILRVLGRGGMGTVYEAEHVRLAAPVAMKVLREGFNQHSARRLMREACLTARINTDHVVRVNDCGTLPDGSPYVIMERLQGEDLRSVLEREQRLTVQAALRIGLEICAGLADLHAIGVVHRDIKPANVFVLNSDLRKCRCKLVDLGIAREFDADTSSAVMLGSVRYMAPEQLTEGKPALAQSDVYALGVILYQCLTGKFPHPGETVEEIVVSILNRRARPVSELRPEISPALSALLMSAIERNPAARPQSATEFARSLAAFSAVDSSRALSLGAHDTTRVGALEFPRRVGRGRVVFLGLIAALALGLWLSKTRIPSEPVTRLPPRNSPADVRIAAAPTSASAVSSAASDTAAIAVIDPPPETSPSSSEVKRSRHRDGSARATAKPPGKRLTLPSNTAQSAVSDLGLDGNPYDQ